MNISPDNTTTLLNSYSFILMVGIGSFIVMMLGMVALFGLSMKETKKQAKGIGMLFVLSLITPLAISRIYQKSIVNSQAASMVKIENVKTQTFGSKTVLLSFSTVTPIISYVEYKDLETNKQYPLLQNNKTDVLHMHSFVINNVSVKGGEAVLILDGKRYLIDGKPLRISIDK